MFDDLKYVSVKNMQKTRKSGGQTLFHTVTANEKIKCDLLTNVGGIVAGLYWNAENEETAESETLKIAQTDQLKCIDCFSNTMNLIL